MDADLWMVVGLGNPGHEYQQTRHNVGFMVLDTMAERGDLDWKSSNRFEAQFAKGRVARQGTVLVKPQTYMNLSGRAVQPLANFYNVRVDHIIAVHDDVDLELGRLRVKAGGGDGGHKGIRSMAQLLGSPAFYRVRFGIGRPERGDVSGFVLHAFDAEEAEQVEQQVERAAKAVGCLMTRGLKDAMNRFNGPVKSKNKEQPPGEADADKDKQQ